MCRQRFLGLLLVCVLVVAGAAAGCGWPGLSTVDEAGLAGGKAAGSETSEWLDILFVTAGSDYDDKSFNFDNYSAVVDFLIAEPHARMQTLRADDPGTVVQLVEDNLNGFDVVVMPSFDFAGIGEVADRHPDRYFILIDSYPSDGRTRPNLYAMQFREQESGFLAGVAAAMQSHSGKVASVGGMDYPAVLRYMNGFEAGVRFANENHGTNVEVLHPADKQVFVGSFEDADTAYALTTELIDEGADIVFSIAGGAGDGILRAVEDHRGALFIGCDVDQSYMNPRVVLTSAVKHMRQNVLKQLYAIDNGTFVGANVTLGADSDATGVVMEHGHHKMDDITLAAVTEAQQQLVTGKLSLPEG